MKQTLKTNIEDLIGHLGQSNPKLNGRWVDTGKTADKLVQLIQQTFESCLPKKRIAISEDPHSHYDFSFNEAIDKMKSNFKAILEGK